MPLELKNPAGLWLLSLAIPLVALYILKIRRKRLPIPSTWLWVEAQRDLLARHPFKKLVVQLPLLLQLLAIALLALALSRPATRGGAIIGDHVAILVDTSASMGAQADGKRRIDLAKKAALDVIAALGPSADAMIIDAGREPRVASPLDRDRRRLEAAVSQLDARDVEGHLGKAIALASDRLRQLPGDARVVVITDEALADPGALLAARLPTDLIKVGTEVDNTAVVRVDVRSGVDRATKSDQVQAFAMLAHYGQSPRDVFVTLRQRNIETPLASRKLRLEPGERAPVVLTFEPARGDYGSGLIVEISPSDSLPADDRAYGRVPSGQKLPVVLVSAKASTWLQRALLADPDVELMRAKLGELGSAEIPDGALIVIDGACPPVPPGGDLLIVNPPAGPCHTATVTTELEGPEVTSWSDNDPRLRFLTLDGVQIVKARRIETSGAADSLVRAREGTLVSDISLPGRTGTLVGFDVGESNWPLKASFVLFVRNIIELARSHRARGITGPARTGGAMRIRVPPDIESVEVERPDKTKSTALARNGLVVVPEVGRAGFYFASWGTTRKGSVLVPANLTSEAESDLSVREVAKPQAALQRKSADDVADAFTDWTWLLAAIALLLVVLDAWWLTRKPKIRSAVGVQRPKLPERSPA